MDDFVKKNRVKVDRNIFKAKEQMVDDFVEIIKEDSEHVSESYRFTEDEGLEIKKSLKALIKERLDGMPEDELLVMSKSKSVELEKQNKKYSDKDRRDNMELAKSIRTDKMKSLIKMYDKKKKANLKKKKEMPLKEEIEFKEKLIDLDTKSVEAYIKACTVNDDKEKIDLAMNGMRNLYRKIGVYMEYLRVGKDTLAPMIKEELKAKIEIAKNELTKSLSDPKIVDSPYFSWKKIGPESMKVEEAQPQANEQVDEEAHEEVDEQANEQVNEEVNEQANEQVNEEVNEQANVEIVENKVEEVKEEAKPEVKPFVWTKDRLDMVKSGKLGTDQKKKNQEEWFVKDHAKAVEEWFKDKEEMDDQTFVRTLMDINDNIQANMGSLRTECQDKELESVTLGFSELEKRLMEAVIKSRGKTICDSKSFNNIKAADLKTEFEQEFKKYSDRKKELEKDADFDLKNRGEDIWKSKAMQLLVTEGSYKDEAVMKKLKKQIRITDKALDSLLAKHGFFLMKDKVKKSLKAFLGDEALFGNLKRVKNKADQYISMLSLYDHTAARTQKDFVVAYKDKVKGVFAGSFSSAAQMYLANFNDWNSEKDRRTNMKDRLWRVGIFAKNLEERTENSHYTKEEWDKLASDARKFIREKLSTVLIRVDEKTETDNCKKQVSEFFEKFHSQAMKDRETKQGQLTVMTQKEWYKEVSEEPEEKKALKQGDNIEAIPSYLNRLTGDELLDSAEVKKVLKDDEREFLKENLRAVLIENEELKEKLPFMAEVKGMEQLEILTQDQFDMLCAHLKENLCSEELNKTFTGLNRSKALSLDTARRNVLLKSLKNRQSADSLTRLIEDEKFLAKQMYNAQKKRLLLKLGTDREIKLSRSVNFRFDEVPEDRADGEVIAKRQSNMKKAAEVWKKLEALGPEAVAQMRLWIGSVVGTKNTEGVIRNRDARHFLAWLSGANKIASDNKFFGWLGIGEIEIQKSLSAIYTVDPQLQIEYEKRCAQRRQKEGDRKVAASLLDDIKEIFSKGFNTGEFIDGLEAGKQEVKEEEKYDFGIELCLCGAQDVLMGQDGSLFKGFFAKDNDEYKAAVEEAARFAMTRLERMDKDLENYPDEVHDLLSKKLRRAYLTAVDDPAEALAKKTADATFIANEKEKRKKRLEEAQKNLANGEYSRKLAEEEDKKWNDEAARRQKDIEDTEKKLSDRQERNKYLVDAIAQKEGTVKKAEPALVKLQNDVKEKEEVVKGLDVTFKMHESEVNKQLKTLNDLEAEAAVFQKKIDDANATVKQLRAKYYKNGQTSENKKIIQKQLDETRANRDQVEVSLKKNQGEMKPVKSALKAAQKLYNAAEKTLNKEKNKLGTLQENEKNTRETLESDKEFIVSGKKELEEGTEEIGRLTTEIQTSKDKLLKDQQTHKEEREKQKLNEADRKKEEEEAVKILEARANEGNAIDDARLARLQKEIDELSKSKGNADVKNHELIGASSLGQLKEIFTKAINTEGVMDSELLDTVKLFEKRMALLENAGKGELRSISAQLIDNDEIFGALMDQAPSVAEKKIEELTRKFSAIGKLLSGRPEHLKNVFLKGRMEQILKEEKTDGKTEAYWKKEIEKVEEEYFSQKNGLKGSIEANREKGEEVLEDYIKDHISKYSDVKMAKNNFKAMIDMTVAEDPEMFMELFTQKGAQLLYERITQNHDANVAAVKREFYRQMYIFEEEQSRLALKENEDDETVRLDNAAITDKELEEFRVKWEKKAGKNAAKRMFTIYEQLMAGNVIKLTNEELKKRIEGEARDFVRSYMKNDFKPEILKEQSDEEKQKHAKAKADAKLKASTHLTDGVNAHDELFFGDAKTANAIKKLSETGFSLAYKKFNKNARPKDEEDTKDLLKSAWKMLSKEREGKKVPSILTDILAEYKILKKEINAAKDEEYKLTPEEEAKRLWKIYEYGSDAGAVEEKALDIYTVYAARHWDGKSDDGLKSLTREFKNFYVSIKDLKSLELEEPAVKAEHADMCDKMLLYVIEKGKSLELNRLNADIIRQKEYFKSSDQVYKIMKKVLAEHDNTKHLDDVTKEHYIRGLGEYLRADIIKNRTENPDENDITTKIKEVLENSYLLSAVSHGDEQVLSTDFFETKAYPGAVKLTDFEKKIRELAPEDYVREYNSLSVEQRQMFAVALYSSRQEESGSIRVVFGVKEEELKANREKFKNYIKGKDAEFDVDYGRSLRKLMSKTGTMKEHFSKTMFREALDFVKKVDKKREELRPKEWERIDDAKTIIEAARAGLLEDNHMEDKKYLDNPPTSQAGFMKALEELAAKDKVRRKKDVGFFGKLAGGFGAIKWFKGESIDDLMGAVKELKPYQMRMLVYVLQNRSALDFSTAGKDDDGTYSYANKKKRFELIEELTDESKNMIALTDADSEEMLGKALFSLMSYQLKDNAPLTEGGLKKEDFAEEALSRVEAIDWKLLLSALNLVQEIDNERLRLHTVQQASERFKASCENIERDKADAAQKAYLDKKDEIQENRESFETFINDMAKRDVSQNSGDKEVVDALMSGYMALTDKEKALFVRALEHRDILDISQKNLYRNFYSDDAERDFVNAKGRDELIDEYLLNASGAEGRVAVKGDSYTKAFESLLSTQLDDSVDFTDAGMISWADKDIRVNKQIFVTKRKTAMDWKLFARALQFVTRASNECQMAAGDKEIYRSTGDVTKLGRMSFDRSFLRTNIHRTGGRLARFLASQTIDLAQEKLGFLGTLADLSEFVVAEETSNFIHEAVNPFLKKDADEDEDDDDDDDKEDEEEKEQENQQDNQQDNANGENANGDNEQAGNEEVKEEKAAEDGQEEVKVEKTEEEKKKEEEEKKKQEEQEAKEKAEKEDAERRKPSEVVKNLSTIAGAYSDHKDKILKISGSLKTAYTDIGKELYKDIFGGDEEGREEVEKDKLAMQLEGVEIEGGKKKIKNAFDVVDKVFDTVDGILAKPGEILGRLSTDDFGIVGTVYKYGKMGADYAFMGKEYLDKYLRDSPEMLESVDGMIKSYLNGFISTKSIGEWYTKNIDGNINKAVKFFVDDRIPKEVQDAIKSFADTLSDSKELLGTISDYLDPAVGMAMSFKGIYDNVKNIVELKKTKNEAMEKAAEDEQKLKDTKKNRNEEKNDLAIRHAAINNALVTAGLDTTKSIQSRQILDHLGDAVENAGKIITTFDSKFTLVGLGVDAAVTIFQKGMATASFIMQCMNDSSMLKEWFNGAGRGTMERLESGKEAYEKMNTVQVGPALAEQIGEAGPVEEAPELQTLQGQIRADGRNAAREYTGDDVTFARRAMGFERNEELNQYMALNMVHSMLFTASDYNILEEPKMMAKVTMTILGLEDLIGKTDSQTAMKVYAKLRE